jgi:hypothetical protein
LDKLLSHRKHGDGGHCLPAETTSGPVQLYVLKLHSEASQVVVLLNDGARHRSAAVI